MRRLTPRARRAALAVAAVLALAGAALLLGGEPGGAAAVEPVAGALPDTAAPRSGAPAPAAAPSSVPPARFTPSSGTRLVVPSLGMDLPMLPMTPDGDTIDPPLLTAAYWIEPYGAPVDDAAEATNTLYVAAHSAGHGSDGFDPLIAADGRGSTLARGDVVEVRTPTGTVRYTVRSTHRYGKEALPGAADVWEAVPGRLVLITCFQRADGTLATENLVVVAEAWQPSS